MKIYKVALVLSICLYGAQLWAKTHTNLNTIQYQGPLDANDADQLLVRVSIGVGNGGGSTPACSAMNFTISNFGDVSSAELHYTGTTATYSSPTQLGSADASFGDNQANFSGFTQTHPNNGTYYYWLVINMDGALTEGTQVDASYLSGTYVTSPTEVTTNPTGFRLTGRTYDIGGDYATLEATEAAFADFYYDDTDTIFFEFSSSYSNPAENTNIVFDDKGPSPATHAVYCFRPASGETGKITGGDPGATTPFITLSNVTHFVFDGRPAGSGTDREWTIKNTRLGSNADVYPTFRLEEGASNCTFRYLNIEGEANYNAGYDHRGIVALATDATNSGNDDNTFSYCHIRDLQVAGVSNSTNLPVGGISSLGTTGSSNSGNTIDNCRFYDIFHENSNGKDANIRLDNFSDNFTITNNHIYQTLDYTGAVSQGSYIIGLPQGTGHLVEGNFIGGRADSCGGAAFVIDSDYAWFVIYARQEGASETIIRSNTIANIDITCDYPNNATPAVTAIALRATGTPSGSLTCDSNTIGNAEGSIICTDNENSFANGFRGISNLYAGTGNLKITHNNIGGIDINGTEDGVTSWGINSGGGSSTPAVTIEHNTIGTYEIDMQKQSDLHGIYLSPSTSTTQTLQKNTIKNLSYTGGGAAVATVYGINIAGSNTRWKVYNNIILLNNAANTDDVALRGILDNSGASSTTEILHNVAKIYGTNTGSATSSAYFRNTDQADTVKNNIWQNLRTSTGGLGNFASMMGVASLTNYNGDYNYIEVTENTANTGHLFGTGAQTVANYQTNVESSNTISGTTTINAQGGAGSGFAGENVGFNSSAYVTDDVDGTARTNPVWMGAFEGPGSLPIVLSSFEVTCENSSALINWTTVSEINNDYFELQCSEDVTSFETIEMINGAGNSNQSLDYATEDQNIKPNQTTYYRLKQVDFDGQTSYSDIVSVNCSSDNLGDQTFMLYPNPISQNGSLIIKPMNKGFTNSLYNVKIYNLLGELIVTIDDLAGQQELTLPYLSNGAYSVQIITQNGSVYKEFVVQ